MSEQKINIHPAGDTINIREGKAERLEQVKPVDIKGDFSAPHAYFKHHNVQPGDIIVLIVDNAAKTLQLHINPQHTHSTITVTGSVRVNPLVATFNINTDIPMKKDLLVRKLKMHRYAFDRDANMRLVNLLEKFDATVERTLKDHNDKKGSYHYEVKQLASTELPDSIEMKIAVFPGMDEYPFNVELNFELEGDSPVFVLYSPQLQEYITRTVQVSLEEQVTLFGKKIPIIYK